MNKALKRAEANYWKKLLSEVQEGSTNFWNIVKQVNKQVNVQSKIGQLRDENNKLAYDDCEKATIVNIFFATIGEKLAYNFPPSQVDTLLINRDTRNTV